MTEREEFLYKVIEAIAQTKSPIIFKGALITKLLLRGSVNSIERETKDIDCDWIGEEVTMEQLNLIISKAASTVGDFTVERFREFGEGRSAGFNIISKQGDKYASVDISIKDNPYYQVYKIGECEFRGSTVDKIVAGKMLVVSCEKIFRRVKDVVDLYALSFCTSFRVNKVYEVLSNSNKLFGDFKMFLSEKEKIEHAYEKMNGIEKKPSFLEVYDRVCILIEPFLLKEIDLVWSPSNGVWQKEDAG